VIGESTARVVLGASLLPFLYFAGRDQVLHFSARRVPLAETIVHFFLGAILIVLIARAFLFQQWFVTIGFLIFAVFGLIDEFVFHRGLPASESDVHAKEHFTLFVFVAVFEVLALGR
jgi:hypothetical protein